MERHFYEIPVRPFQDVFSINIAFTLVRFRLWTKWSRQLYQRLNVAGNDTVVSSHINFGNPVAAICSPYTYNVQVENATATALEDERIAIYL